MDSDLLPYLFSHTALASPCWKYGLVERCNSLEELFESIYRLFDKKEIDKYIAFSAKSREKSFSKNVNVVHYFSKKYPTLLKEIYHPPLTLFYKGKLEILSKNYIAVVGTRKPSPIALAACDLLPEFISRSENTGIVSGLAIGIDKRAMEACLQNSIPTVGVMGTGFDKYYPASNRDLYEKMLNSQDSIILTEMYWGEPVGKWSFPRRNRIITGLAKTLLVMEAPLDSGAMSSASHALSQNRDIIVFDDIVCLRNEGGKKLISDGASSLSLDDLTAGRKKLVHISELFPASYSQISGALGLVSNLEMQGVLLDRGGGYYEWKADA